jgi:hypothetical protein
LATARDLIGVESVSQGRSMMHQTIDPQSPRNGASRNRRLWMAAAAVAAAAAAGCASGSPSGVAVPPHPTSVLPRPTGVPRPTTAAPSSPGAKPGEFGDGTYTVGQTVKAGTYRAPGPGSTCYWARLRGFGGSGDEIIANNVIGDPTVVTIAPTDKGFQTSGCDTPGRRICPRSPSPRRRSAPARTS